MTRRPKILITNDDGIDAPGILNLWESIKDYADCTIVAPASEQSGRGMAISIHRPVRLTQVDWPENTPAYKVTGTPVDAVKLALGVVLPEQPDYVLAGINNGSNAGRNLLYSGTIGTIIEACIRGIPGIALSCVDYKDCPYDIVKPYVPRLIEYLKEHPLAGGTALNVNFPDRAAGPFRGLRLATQGNGYWTDAPIERVDHNESPYFWLGGRNILEQEEESADTALLSQGYAAAVPFQVFELTNHQELHSRRDHFEKNFAD